HNFTLAGNYEIPYGKGRRHGGDIGAAQDALVGGWNLTSIVTIHSGFPVTVNEGFDSVSLQPSFAFERPNLVGNPTISNPSWDRWFNTSAFQKAAPGTFGNSPVGVLRGPGYWNLDLGIDKHFNLFEQRYAVFRLEAFNLFNHFNKGMPHNN